MAFDRHRLCIELQRLDWGHELKDEIVREIVDSAELAQYKAGQPVIKLDQAMDRVYFVIQGRLSCVLFDKIGKTIHREILGRGSVIGLFSAPLAYRSRLQIEAVEPTTVIHLSLDELLRLASRYREFQLSLLRSSANLVKRIMQVDRERPKPAVVGIIHHSQASRALAAQLTGRLRQLGESPCVVGDDDRWIPQEGIPFRLFKDGICCPEEAKRILDKWTAHRRLFIDLWADHSDDDLNWALCYSDIVLWCIRPQDVADAARKLRSLACFEKGLHDKVRIVWSLAPGAPEAPYVPELYDLTAGDFKTYSGQPQPNHSKLLQNGVERIVHYLRGVQIGLALGGGAARGMAHLGVLKSLEEHGIFVDMLAGTSVGAMVGILYASGMNPEYAAQAFKRELMPSWLFRHIPSGGYWYLLYKYRRHQFEPMLRKYLDHLHAEQLIIPATTIAVDLVDGTMLVRDTGDATRNVLESINLPPLSVPIVQGQQAVVDGGLLNNVPADAMVARGCNFVIASTVTAELEKDFMGIRSQERRGSGRFTTTIQVILRQNMIQDYNMNAVGIQPADFVIAPDVTSFDISEFTRADEMAVIGESASNESVHQLKGMLAKLDPHLFA
ncbi:MAG: patatin-like phospholipase family protein [Chloracidobacterium sp.]|nr:patatin-like phospholipase family protein [Chloracidobacterium sp.]